MGDHEPPAAPHVDVRRIETLEQQLAALEVDWDVWNLPESERVSRRAYQHERFVADGTVHHFAAYEDERPVGLGRAIDMDAGVGFRCHGELELYVDPAISSSSA